MAFIVRREAMCINYMAQRMMHCPVSAQRQERNFGAWHFSRFVIYPSVNRPYLIARRPQYYARYTNHLGALTCFHYLASDLQRQDNLWKHEVSNDFSCSDKQDEYRAQLSLGKGIENNRLSLQQQEDFWRALQKLTRNEAPVDKEACMFKNYVVVPIRPDLEEISYALHLEKGDTMRLQHMHSKPNNELACPKSVEACNDLGGTHQILQYEMDTVRQA